MASLRSLYAQEDNEGLDSNYGVDYVVYFKVPPEEAAEAEAEFVQLIEALTKVGLTTEVRPGDDEHSLLVFVRIASDSLLAAQAYRSRLQDWLHGVRTDAPGRDLVQSLRDEPMTDAERLRLIYLLIGRPRNEGGAGITPKSGPWAHVDSVFPLHDHAFNRRWLKQWSTKYFLDRDDLDDIRNRFGEDVAFYFAFTQAYFSFLALPAAFGFGAWWLLGHISWVYVLACSLWSVVFFEYWKMREVDLAVLWGVRGVSSIQLPRPQFKFDYEAEDPVTGEVVKVYSPFKRLRTQLLQVPFALACIVVLGATIVMGNSLEIFINELYSGPFKEYLSFLPTILLVVLIPTFSTVLTKFAEALTEMENYETIDSHHAALVQKEFVLNFITSYMPLLFTAFIYIPFGDHLLPYLHFWNSLALVFIPEGHKGAATLEFKIDPGRISSQMFYSTVTAQIVNFATEVIVPYVKRRFFREVKEVQSKIHKSGTVALKDAPEEAAFLERVRNEVQLETYDVTVDYREMVIQFGYLTLFSVVWPLTGFCFFLNNWVELRSDALKIAMGSRRPIPWRADSIGPWLDSLGFLSWIGTVTSAAMVFLLTTGTADGLDGSRTGLKAWGLLLSILVAEHFYLVVQQVVRLVFSKVDSPGLQKERKEKYEMKKQLLAANLGQGVSEEAAAPGVAASEKITKESLAEEARQAGSGTPEQAFWRRQKGMAETIQVGRTMIAKQNASTSKPTKA